ncbi:PQQ-dependent sugar dehydrogenase [Vibrio hannami]|uniref:PQQ-dependent sugar dehydrogenase n=1 Tax=Vibrio hannami TaxID=2717094 RepID=UPI002410678B|nr:PQQ-dependent sugar dehydrogenase [Vibrio hannami]MDG3088012.1 PQQ-dependent sugar dehydrogenase [Vibrio hannami]
MKSTLKLFSYAALLLPGVVAAASFNYQLVGKGFNVPWGLAFLDKSTLIVSERNGGIQKLNLETGNISPQPVVKDIYARGQGGLMDVAVHGDHVYLTYSKSTPQGSVTALARSKILQGSLSKWEDIFISDSASDTTRHFGSRVAFDGKDHLFLSIGDRGERSNGQNTSNHAGSILRLNLDGSVPDDNPFTDKPTVRDEIWSFGHRNPQGLFYDAESGNLWSIEHGPRGGDEVNLILEGANYGWPLTSHGKEYWGPIDVADYQEKDGIESPKKVYIPSIAPSNILLYRGERYPSLKGKLVAGALKLAHLNALTLDEGNNIVDEQRIAEELGERIRDVEISPDGYIYFSTDRGNIYRLLEG